MKTFVDGFKPASLRSFKPRRQAISLSVPASRFQRLAGNVGTYARYSGTFMKQSQTNSPGSRSDIEYMDIADIGFKAAYIRQHRIDENFRIGPRFERCRRKPQRETVKFPLTENAVNRFVIEPADNRRPHRRRVFLQYRLGTLRHKPGDRKMEKTPDKNAGFRSGIIEIGLGKAGAHLLQEPGYGRPLPAAHACSPSWASWLAW